MKRWCVPAVFAGLLFAACGDDASVPPGEGTGEGNGSADGGLDAAAEAAAQTDDTDASCGSPMTAGGAEGGGCTATQTYSCGASTYEIVCSSPAATCACTKNGTEVGTATWSGCSGGAGTCAISFRGVAEQCGIPSGGGGPSVPPPPDDE